MTGNYSRNDYDLSTPCIGGMIKRFDVQKTSMITASADVDLGPRKEGEPGWSDRYREAVGSLMWVAHMRTVGIVKVVHAVARQCQHPTVSIGRQSSRSCRTYMKRIAYNRY